jgi:predicted CopG family antitoxin
MRKRINIMLDDVLYKNLKKRAGKEKSSISGIIETALKKTALREKKSGLLELIDSLPPSRLVVSGDLKKQYFESKA